MTRSVIAPKSSPVGGGYNAQHFTLGTGPDIDSQHIIGQFPTNAAGGVEQYDSPSHSEFWRTCFDNDVGVVTGMDSQMVAFGYRGEKRDSGLYKYSIPLGQEVDFGDMRVKCEEETDVKLARNPSDSKIIKQRKYIITVGGETKEVYQLVPQYPVLDRYGDILNLMKLADDLSGAEGSKKQKFFQGSTSEISASAAVWNGIVKEILRKRSGAGVENLDLVRSVFAETNSVLGVKAFHDAIVANYKNSYHLGTALEDGVGIGQLANDGDDAKREELVKLAEKFGVGRFESNGENLFRRILFFDEKSADPAIFSNEEKKRILEIKEVMLNRIVGSIYHTMVEVYALPEQLSLTEVFRRIALNQLADQKPSPAAAPAPTPESSAASGVVNPAVAAVLPSSPKSTFAATPPTVSSPQPKTTPSESAKDSTLSGVAEKRVTSPVSQVVAPPLPPKAVPVSIKPVSPTSKASPTISTKTSSSGVVLNAAVVPPAPPKVKPDVTHLATPATPKPATASVAAAKADVKVAAPNLVVSPIASPKASPDIALPASPKDTSVSKAAVKAKESSASKEPDSKEDEALKGSTSSSKDLSGKELEDRKMKVLSKEVVDLFKGQKVVIGKDEVGYKDFRKKAMDYYYNTGEKDKSSSAIPSPDPEPTKAQQLAAILSKGITNSR